MANKYLLASATGTGSGDSWTDAYTTTAALKAGLSRLVNNVAYVGVGSYVGTTWDIAVNGSTVITVKRATVADHGTGTGWLDTFAAGQATFSSKIEWSTSYWVFDGITGGGPGAWYSGFGFKITETSNVTPVMLVGRNTQVSNITIRHVEVQGKGSGTVPGAGDNNDGLAIYDGTTVTLSYAWMYGIGRCPFFSSCAGLIAEYVAVSSYFSTPDGHSEIASMWAFNLRTLLVGDHTFRYCLLTDYQGTGGFMWDNSSDHNASCYIYGCVFYKPASATWDSPSNGFIGSWDGGGGEDCYNQHTFNCTFINCDRAPFSSGMARFGNLSAYNNFFYTTMSPDYTKIALHDYSEYNNSGGTHSEANGTTSSGDQFTNYVGLDFTLIGNTAAGTNLGAPYNVDGLGHTRITWTRGAYEFFLAGAGLILKRLGAHLKLKGFAIQ